MADKTVIKMHPVNSSNIAQAGYDEQTKTLEIHFKNGSKYQYEGIAKYLYEGIFNQHSPGAFLRKWIIKPNYPFKKLPS